MLSFSREIGESIVNLNPIWRFKMFKKLFSVLAVLLLLGATIAAPALAQGKTLYCAYFLESSHLTKLSCSTDPATMMAAIPQSSFLIARFYNYTNYGGLLAEYYAGAACSSTQSWSAPTLGSNDNKFESARGYSNCDYLTAYEGTYFNGGYVFCAVPCASFYSFNNKISSWWIEH